MNISNISVRLIVSLHKIVADGQLSHEDRLLQIAALIGENFEVDEVRIDRISKGGNAAVVLATWNARNGEHKPMNSFELDSDEAIERYGEGEVDSCYLDSSPLFVDNKLIGFIHLIQKESSYDWTEAHQNLLRSCAQTITTGINLAEEIEAPVVSLTDEPEFQAEEPKKKKSGTEILIVEDDSTNAYVLKKIIQREGANPTVVHSGEDAVKICKNEVFDIILMDLRMPGLDGFDATRAIIGGDGPNRQTPIIAVTADTTEGIERRCAQLGIRHYIPKPIRASVISDIIYEFTDEEDEEEEEEDLLGFEH